MKLPPAMIERVADRFKVLADPVRLSLLARLQQGEANVSTLVKDCNLPQATVSKHLKVLRLGLFVQVRRVGTEAFYSILDPSVNLLCELMCTAVVQHLQKDHEVYLTVRREEWSQEQG